MHGLPVAGQTSPQAGLHEELEEHSLFLVPSVAQPVSVERAKIAAKREIWRCFMVSSWFFIRSWFLVLCSWFLVVGLLFLVPSSYPLVAGGYCYSISIQGERTGGSWLLAPGS